MPMPKPEKPEDLNIGANGTTNQVGRPAKTLDVKVIKPFKLKGDGHIPDLHLRMVELAEKAKAKQP